MPRYTQLRENEIQEIAGQYNLSVAGAEAIEGGAGNSSYLLRTRQGEYVLTVFDDKSLAYVVRLGQLLLLLAENEFPTTRPLSSVKRGLITVYRAKPVMLKAYITGQVCRNLTEPMLYQVGASLARLHQVPAPDFLPTEHPYGRQDFPTVIGRNVDPQYESWLADRLAYLERSIPRGLPSGLIHGDLFYDNVLFEEERFKAIIDFEEACRYYKGFDLGMGVLGLCEAGGTVALDKVRALATGYQQGRMLEEIEKEALQLLVEYAAIATSYWRFWKYHIHTPLSSNVVTVSMRCFSDRPSRSSRQTTRVSPSLTYAFASLSPGRSTFAPLTWSWKIFLQPACSKASFCSEGFCSWVETRA